MDNNNQNDLEKNLESFFADEEEDTRTVQRQNNGYARSNSVRMKKYRSNKLKKTILIIAVALVLLGLWLLSAWSIVNGVLGEDVPATDTTEVTQGDKDETTDSVTDGEGNEDKKPDNALTYTTYTMFEDSHKVGKLILINSTYKYDYTADTYLTKELVSIRAYSNDAYSVPYNTDKLRVDTVTALNRMFATFKEETGLTGYSIRPDYAYCTPDDQQSWYESSVNKHGEGVAPSMEFKGGESEHEAGRTFDIKVEQNGQAVYIREADERYTWIYDNCYKFGFIYRYPKDKSTVTGVSMSEKSVHYDHFRYVGVAPAYAMKQNGWCLEEFLVEIEKYTYNGEQLKVTDDEGNEYMMYYFPANKTGDTAVQVPEGLEYEISGNNIDGFIVTATLKKASATE